MPDQELIETLLAKELQGLCMNCVNFETCAYRKNTMKVIIQCELHEIVSESRTEDRKSSISKGLCANCCNVDLCRLPDKQFGVWHCEEYE